MKKSSEITIEECKSAQREVPEYVFKEMEILDSFLPQQMNESEIEVEVIAIINEIGATSVKILAIKGVFDKFIGAITGFVEAASPSALSIIPSIRHIAVSISS